jgi:alpha-glucosidase
MPWGDPVFGLGTIEELARYGYRISPGSQHRQTWPEPGIVILMLHVPRTWITLALLPAAAWGQGMVKSPDGSIELSFSANQGQLAYSVSYRGRPILVDSALGLEMADQPVLGSHVRIVRTSAGAIDETYSMPHGKSNPIRNVCRKLSLEIEETAPPSRKFTVEARAYDDGVAFRYLVPAQAAMNELRLAAESTEFRLAKDATTYPIILDGFHTPYEDAYLTMPLSGIHPSSLVGLPLLAELPGVAWIAITEANIDDYAGIYLQHSARDARLLSAHLAPSVDHPALAVQSALPAQTPWRVIMIGAQPGRLIESNIVINLNPPSQIADTSWIKPGKTAWDWWSGTYAGGVNFKPGMNTATIEHYIDFASSAGFPYMLIDAGWAARGSGPNDSGSDLTHTNPAIDMPHILEHAREKNVRIWLWAHWSDINNQVDQAFPLFEKWGIAGVKIDFMNRDDQWMVNFYRKIVQKAAAHHLMIDYHGAFKPDGMRRTWPNLMTREGVMGAEYNKWSARITPDHNVMLAFTRMLAGPMDYTPGGFNNATRAEFEPRNKQPMVMGTRAHALALYAIFESPFQMVSDYPEAYQGQKEFDYIRAVPTVWDETHVLTGRPGEDISIARRHGKEWFVGSITGWRTSEFDIPLEFLGPGEFLAEMYSDAPDSEANPKHTVREERRVSASTTLHVKMVSGGGQAIRIYPAR